jgi:DNA-binding response OmpR family regulator
MAENRTSPDDPTTVAARPRLLVVDDLEDNRIVMTRRFQRRGFEVMEAERGREALEMIGVQRFDLVLLDIVMPDMDGFEVLARIRQIHSSTELPVIMVTARDGRVDIVQALELGANDYLVKPVDFDMAHASVQANVARKQADDRLRDRLLEAEALVTALKDALPGSAGLH